MIIITILTCVQSIFVILWILIFLSAQKISNRKYPVHSNPEVENLREKVGQRVNQNWAKNVEKLSEIKKKQQIEIETRERRILARNSQNGIILKNPQENKEEKMN